MSLELKIQEGPAKPGLYFGGLLNYHPDPARKFHADRLTAKLLGISETRMVAGNPPEQKVYEKCETFLELESKRPESSLGIAQISLFYFHLPLDPTSEFAYLFEIRKSQFPDMSKPQALPPSGDFGSGNRTIYKFEVSLHDKHLPGELKISTPFTFAQTREIDLPDPKLTTIVQDCLLAHQDKTSSSSKLRIGLESPGVIVQDQNFPLKIRLLHDGAQSSMSPPTTIHLKSGFLRLLENTTTRSGKNHVNHWTNKHTMGCCDFSAHGPGTEIIQVTMEGIDMATLFGMPSIPCKFVPTFDCVNIKRTYGLEVGLTCKSEGESFELVFTTGPVTLLAAELASVARAKQEKEAYDDWFCGPFPEPQKKPTKTLQKRDAV